ncbi:translation initiation factor IF-3 [Thermoanaerobacterium sp. RBIITD]|uniref:translation initiation factor IF-3 n=1 Tax=Thermoanaerobacterium sp. RBIITD TaxID=1550240 RepID=UPI001E455480
MNKELQVNEEIRDKEVRLIDQDGNQLGLMSAKEAYKIAMERHIDLVKIAPQANPPVCKLMDFGKYRYEQSKKEKESKKKQKVINIKEIRMTPAIEEHDFGVKLKSAMKFLKDGNKVKVTIRFRGREAAHTTLAEELLNKFAKNIEEFGVVEKTPNMEGRNLMMVIAPKNV